ncbi:MAG: hypothetical protein GY906_04890 [bacterium]|nr:hypothetical protein [bacterium]
MTSCFQRYATPSERSAARKLVRTILNAGFVIRVYDSAEFNTDHDLSTEADVLAELATSGDDRVYFRKPGDERFIGWFWLIWGNGEDLISDYNVNETTEKIASIACEVVA